MAESNLNRIIKTQFTPSGYSRPDGVPNGESIIANAPVIESGGVNYYPIYYICAMDTVTGATFSKTGDGVSTGADAYVFSDEPSTLYVGDTTHTFDVADDFATSEGWKCRYVIAYATEANKDDVNGITVNLYSYRATFEFIGSQYLKLSSTSALFGSNSMSNSNQNLRYVNLSSSIFYDNTISAANFCRFCCSLASISLPSVTTISTNYFCGSCYSLTSISLPSLTTIAVTSSYFCGACYSLRSISLPSLTTVDGNSFCANCYPLKRISLPSLITVTGTSFCVGCCYLEYFEIPSTITTLTNTSADTLNYIQFIGLPTNFDIDACNFTGIAGYTKSLAWFTHLAAQLKDNSGGTAKTMTLGATNIALIPSAQATIISNKNWTIN